MSSPIETERASVEDILRPLAERPCPIYMSSNLVNERTGEVSTGQHVVGCPGGCKGTGLDPRFEALRRRVTDAEWVMFTWPDVRDPSRVVEVRREWFLDASLGAIVRAAAACGWESALGLYEGPEKGWYAVIGEEDSEGYLEGQKRLGATPEEALARALAAAVGDASLHWPTAPQEGNR